MIAGCYSLDLYCENYNGKGPWPDEHGHGFDTFPKQYIDEFGSACRRMARADGWVLRQDGKAYCPTCNPNRKKP